MNVPRTIKDAGEVYININDIIEKIEDHQKSVKTGGKTDYPYSLAHDHIIELISIYNEN